MFKTVDKQPQVRCGRCTFYTCFTDKVEWHVGQTCEQYKRFQAEGDRYSEQAIRRRSKRCPGFACGIRIQKQGGCHEIECPPKSKGGCGIIFCWNCKMIQDSSLWYSDRHKVGHLLSCDASAVREVLFRTYAARPSMPNAKYREGWDKDPGYIGEGDIDAMADVGWI